MRQKSHYDLLSAIFDMTKNEFSQLPCLHDVMAHQPAEFQYNWYIGTLDKFLTPRLVHDGLPLYG